MAKVLMCRVEGFGKFRVEHPLFTVKNTGCRVLDVGCRVSDAGCRV
jgi:hypothetical protein